MRQFLPYRNMREDHCQKCGFKAGHDVQYQAVTISGFWMDKPLESLGEHLAWKCRNCGATTRTECHDADPFSGFENAPPSR